jgi:hypothetical protein
MRPDEIQSLLHRRPFEPFRLHISSGETVDVSHPELAFVTRSSVVVGVSESGEPIADYAVHYSLIHIVKIEPLNGRRGQRRPKGKR